LGTSIGKRKGKGEKVVVRTLTDANDEKGERIQKGVNNRAYLLISFPSFVEGKAATEEGLRRRKRGEKDGK